MKSYVYHKNILLHFLLHRPVAVLMSALGLIALGVVSLRILPVSLLPDVPIPEVSVQVSYPNTSARELENTVTTPLRNQLLQVGKLRDIHSQTRNGNATITLEFEFGTNTDLAFIEVNEKIDQAMDYLPRDLERPRVIKANVSDIPVFYLSVAPQNLDSLRAEARAQALLELSEFSRVVLKRRIEQLPQVAFVDVSGFAEPEVRIIPDAATMQSLGLREQDIETILQQNNLSLGSIALQDNQYQYNVRFLSTLRSVQDIEQIRFNHQGRVLRLAEIASVQMQTRPRRGMYLHNGQDALVFSMYKQADAQLFDLRASFADLLTSLKKDYPQLGFYISNDQSGILDISINNLLSSLGYGALFAFLILLVFFREWPIPLLIGITVPVSLIMSFLGFYLLGITVNVISLAGLILGVGLLVDNSIIVIENIRQQRAMGLPLAEACAEGGNEVIRPLISSALTTCSVFLPLIFLSGIAGALFYDQAVSISVVLGASLLAAYILIPVLVNLIERKRPTANALELQLSRHSFYYRTVHASIRYPLATIVLFLGVIAGSYWLVGALPQESFPKLSRNAIEVKVDWGEPVSVAENERRVREFLGDFQAQLLESNAFIGEQQFLLTSENQEISETKLVLYYKQSASGRIEQNVKQYFTQQYPGAETNMMPLKNVFDQIFGGGRPDLIVHVQSAKNQQTPSQQEIIPILSFLQQKRINYELLPLQESYTVTILKEPALRYEVSYESIYTRLQTIFGQRPSGIVKATNAYIPIVLSNVKKDLNELLYSATVVNNQNELLPLRYFIHIEKQSNPKLLMAGKSGEALNIVIPDGTFLLVSHIRQMVKELPDVSTSFSGQIFENQHIIKEVSIVALVSLALLYFILAAQFESLLQPFIVLLSVPVGITGAATLLLLSGQSINLISLIGLVVMGGIAVNDAILKVDMMNRLIKTHTLEEAVHLAGYRRLRAIVMTSLTTILALLPVLFSSGLGAELQQPLAFTVIGGLTMTTIASLYFVPALYVMIYRKKKQSGSAFFPR